MLLMSSSFLGGFRLAFGFLQGLVGCCAGCGWFPRPKPEPKVSEAQAEEDGIGFRV